MIGLLRAESISFFKRKLYWVMLAILGVFTGLAALLLILGPRYASEQFPGMPTIAKPAAYLFGVQQVLGQAWFPLVLAAVAVGSEVGSSIWAVQLTRESRRWRHLLVKTLVLTGAGFAAAVLAIAGWSVITAIWAEGSGFPTIGEWTGVAWKTLLVMFIWVSIGVGTVGAFRSVGPAIGAGMGFYFVEQLLALWKPWQNVSLSIASSRLIADLSTTQGSFGVDFGSMTFTRALIVCLAWGLFGVSIAWVGIQLRDP